MAFLLRCRVAIMEYTSGPHAGSQTAAKGAMLGKRKTSAEKRRSGPQNAFVSSLARPSGRIVAAIALFLGSAEPAGDRYGGSFPEMRQ